MADLVDRVMCFVAPGKRVVWQEAVPEKNQKERAYVPCEAVLVFNHDGRMSGTMITGFGRRRFTGT